MVPQPQTLTLPDGRNVDYLVSGARDGFPLVWVHGTPGSCLPAAQLSQVCERKGIKVISISRAGYGASTRVKGRNIVDAVKDLQAVNEHLGVKHCLVGGWSGGGPIALACAARLPGCLAALCVAGVAPYGVEGLDFMAGQGQDNIDEFNAYFEGEDKLTEFINAQRLDILNSDGDGIVAALSSLLPEADKKALQANGLGQDMADGMHEALKNSSDGWFDDDVACFTPWGFEFDEIKVPIVLYQGSDDLMVPFAHGKWLAEHLPKDKLKVHLPDGEGHISIFVGNTEQMVDELKELGGVRK